jgi:SP family sugar:H+ symporter-like MFS transporter
MGFLSRKEAALAAIFNTEKSTPSTNTPATRSIDSGHHSPDSIPVVQRQQDGEKPRLTVLAVLLGAIASIGGFIFGYESGQISGMASVFLAALAEAYR